MLERPRTDAGVRGPELDGVVVARRGEDHVVRGHGTLLRLLGWARLFVFAVHWVRGRHDFTLFFFDLK